MRQIRRNLTLAATFLALILVSCGGGETGEPATTSESGSVASTTLPGAATTANDNPTTTSGDPGDAPELTGTWSVVNYASAELNSITNIWPDTEITLELGSDGSISGNAGCNDYSGRYEVSGPYITEPGLDEERGQAIEVLELSWTEMACDSENLMVQEGEYLDVLQQVEYWSIDTGFASDESLLLRSLTDGLLVEGVRP